MKLKKCCNCFKIKPVADFYLNRTGNKGNERQSRCIDCSAEVLRGWRARKRNALRQAQKEQAEKIFKQNVLKYMKR